jgi:hypothetical protein
MGNTQTTPEVTSSNSTDLRTVQERLTERLSQAGLDTQRFVDVNDGEKRSQDHTQLEYTQISGNYGVYAGYGANEEGGCLFIPDIDDYNGDLDTESLKQLPNTLTVESPHGGRHPYFKVEGPILEAVKKETGVYNPDMPWGETRFKGMLVVGPGSQIEPGEHGCDKDWCDSCADEDGGYYRITQDLPIATIHTQDVLALIESDYEGSSTSGTADSESDFEGVIPEVKKADIPNADGEGVERIYAAASEFVTDAAESEAKETWHDLMAGRYLQQDYECEDGSADRSAAEFALFNFAYGISREHANMPKEEAIEAVGQFITHVCEKNGWTKDGQHRKWKMNPGRYRERIATKTVQNYDEYRWKAWRDSIGFSGEYGGTRYRNLIRAAGVLSINGDYDPERYPDKTRLCEFARKLETNSISEDSYRRATSKLVNEHGKLKKACIEEYVDYRYYPVEAPDPPEAEWVEISGEKREPETEHGTDRTR